MGLLESPTVRPAPHRPAAPSRRGLPLPEPRCPAPRRRPPPPWHLPLSSISARREGSPADTRGATPGWRGRRPHPNDRRSEDPAPEESGRPHSALSLIHISEPTRLGMISYAVFCL